MNATSNFINETKRWLHRQIHGVSYKVEDGVVTWDDYDWGAGSNPVEISAINYSVVRDLRKALTGEQFETAVEIGAGYGRITPWLDLFADDVIAVEPNDDVRAQIETYHPDIRTVGSKAQDLPLADDSCNLIFTRSVLHHVPHEDFETVCAELQRIRSPDGMAVLMEDVIGEDTPTHHPRSIETFVETFDDWTFETNWPRRTPGFEYTIDDQKQVMVFR